MDLLAGRLVGDQVLFPNTTAGRCGLDAAPGRAPPGTRTELTGRAATRLTRTPGWSFFMGVPVTAAVGLWIAIASASGIAPFIYTLF